MVVWFFMIRIFRILMLNFYNYPKCRWFLSNRSHEKCICNLQPFHKPHFNYILISNSNVIWGFPPFTVLFLCIRNCCTPAFHGVGKSAGESAFPSVGPCSLSSKSSCIYDFSLAHCIFKLHLVHIFIIAYRPVKKPWNALFPSRVCNSDLVIWVEPTAEVT